MCTSTPDLPGVIRKLRLREQAQLHSHLLRLDSHDRRMRFCGSASDAQIRRYCQQPRGLNSVVLGFFADGELKGAGELTASGSTPWPISGELALSVEGPFQNRGVGTELVRQLVVVGSNRWMRRIHMLWLPENLRMRAITTRYGPQLRTGLGQIECEIRPPWPTYRSVLEELLTDGSPAAVRDLGRPEELLAVSH